MQNKHTPGSWSVYNPGLRAYITAKHPEPAYDGENIVVAELNGPEDAREVNARLIAAAPDLLAALQAVLSVADRKTDEFDKARAAIAKATGASTCRE